MQPAVAAESEEAAKIEKLSKIHYPLPLSLGAARELTMQSDLEMSAAILGQERTPKQFTDLLARAGFKVINIVQPRAPHGVIEAMLK